MTNLVPMTEAAFVRFREQSIADYAQENIEAGRWPIEGALERSQESYARLLPQGLATPGQHLFTIHDEAQGTDVGVLWLAVTESPSGRSGYVYDVAVASEHRRRGHARAAFIALEGVARELGLFEIGLHVFAHNPSAEALYRSLGYRVTGTNMQKLVR
ncbi:MAG TPA: GNAT family N-acetyltransferase [Ideonella sp.]|nr:GNAT family N-acetyltransferase [Ideonella sp.]